MYIPADFRVNDFRTVRTFLEEHPFGVLLVNGKEGIPVSTHLPFLVQTDGERIVLEGHMARVNEQESYILDGQPAQIIVNGAHGYVSSSVYGHVNVPTYNYQAVHLSGTLERLEGKALLEHLQRVVTDFEKERSQPITFDNWPQEMIQLYLQEIVGFRLIVSKVEAAFKLSQNRNEEDFARIVEDLRQGNPGQVKLAAEMTRWRTKKQ